MKIVAYYSIATGNRVSGKYALANPTKVETYSIDPVVLTANKIAQDTDGAAATLEGARQGKIFDDNAQAVKDAKLAERRARNKAKKAAKTVAALDPKKFTAKKTSRKVQRNTEGEFAPNKDAGKPGIESDLVKLPAKKAATKKAATKKAVVKKAAAPAAPKAPAKKAVTKAAAKKAAAKKSAK